MIIFGCTNRQIHFRNGEIHSFDSYPKLDLDFKPQSLDSKNLDWDLVWEPQVARGSRLGLGAGLETLIFGFEEPGLRPGLGTSSCNRGSELQTLNLGFEEEEEEEGWDLVKEPQATPWRTHRQIDRHHVCFNIGNPWLHHSSHPERSVKFYCLHDHVTTPLCKQHCECTHRQVHLHEHPPTHL
jgi:hypothetical protein